MVSKTILVSISVIIIIIIAKMLRVASEVSFAVKKQKMELEAICLPGKTCRVYAGILKSNVIHFKTFFKTLSIHLKTSSPLWILTGYLGDTLYLTLTIYSIDCPSSLSSNHLDADLHFPITMVLNNRRKRTFARYQAVSVRCPVQMTSNPTGCHK